MCVYLAAMETTESPAKTAEAKDTSAPTEETDASAKSETKKPPVHSFFGYSRLLFVVFSALYEDF